MKQTVAWIGEIDWRLEAFHRLTERYRLIWVTQDEIPADPLTIENPLPEVEVMNCAKEGCWEADIIILAGGLINQELLEKIREVSTQKIVMIITVESKIAGEERISSIMEALSFSKVVEITLSSAEARLSGENPGAVATANDIVQLLGYQVSM